MRGIPGYSIFRKDATSTQERGVAIIAKSSFKIKYRSPNHCITPSSNIELLCINVQINFSKSFIAGCVYRHPDYSAATLYNVNLFFSDFFTHLSTLNKNFYIFGDFNLRDEKYRSPLISILKNLSLVQQIDEPTRGSNILDLIIINNVDTVHSKYVYNPHLSDHSYIQCCIKKCPIVVSKKCLTFRNYKKINAQNIIADLNSLNISLTDSRTATTALVLKILSTIDRFAPIINKTVCVYPSQKYVSSATKDLIKQRDLLYKVHRINPNQQSYKELNQLKKKVDSAIYMDTKLEFSRKVESLHLWGALHKLYPLLEPTPVIKISPDDINKFFVAVSTRVESTLLPDLPVKPNFPWDNAMKKFQFKELTVTDMEKCWRRMKNRTSASCDTLGLCNKMLNICMLSVNFRIQLTKLLNLFITSNHLPSILKLSKVIPIPKTKKVTSPNDLRPISIQPVLAKLLGKCMFDQLYAYLESNKNVI